LLKALKDNDPWVRYYAAQSIGRLGYAPASAEIASLLKDDAGQVRVSAVEALSHLDSFEARSALRDAFHSKDPDVSRAALVGLGIAHRAEDFPLIQSAALSDDPSTRLLALSTMSHFVSPHVVVTLSLAALDVDQNVSAAAIGFLSARAEQDATEVLIELLHTMKTRENARTALLVPSQNRVPGLVAALKEATDETAPVLISILSRFGRPDARRAIIVAMTEGNVAVRKATATALASRPDPDMQAALRCAANHDEDESVRKICEILLRA
jgi:HEAT repeat protein